MRNHESQRDRQILQKPAKITLQDLIDTWNSTVGDVQNVETTQTSTRNLQRRIFYVSREISSQMEREFKNQKYNDIKKAYSIFG